MEMMDVQIDGEIVQRPLKHIERLDGHLLKMVPETSDDEVAIWTIDSLTPIIVKTRES